MKTSTVLGGMVAACFALVIACGVDEVGVQSLQIDLGAQTIPAGADLPEGVHASSFAGATGSVHVEAIKGTGELNTSGLPVLPDTHKYVVRFTFEGDELEGLPGLAPPEGSGHSHSALSHQADATADAEMVPVDGGVADAAAVRADARAPEADAGVVNQDAGAVNQDGAIADQDAAVNSDAAAPEPDAAVIAPDVGADEADADGHADEADADGHADEGGEDVDGHADEGGGDADGHADEGGGDADGHADEGGGDADGHADEGGGHGPDPTMMDAGRGDAWPMNFKASDMAAGSMMGALRQVDVMVAPNDADTGVVVLSGMLGMDPAGGGGEAAAPAEEEAGGHAHAP